MFQKRYRFAASSNVNQYISGSCLLNLEHVSTSATVSYSAFLAVRLLKVEIFGSPVTGIAGPSEAILRYAAHRSAEIVYEDRGTATIPAHIRTNPPPDSDVGRWISFVDTVAEQQAAMFNIVVESGGMVEITLEFTRPDTAQYAPHALTIAAGAAGHHYFNSLDNTVVGAATVGANTLTALGGVDALLAFG